MKIIDHGTEVRRCHYFNRIRIGAFSGLEHIIDDAESILLSKLKLRSYFFKILSADWFWLCQHELVRLERSSIFSVVLFDCMTSLFHLCSNFL